MTRPRISIVLACALLLGGVVGAVSAQPVYRHVGPDGRVTYSDVPPAGNAAQGTAPGGRSGSGNSASLPYELRQASARYPVTLYAGPNCAPCESARGLLASRGIPYQERSVTTVADGDALQRLAGERSLPLLTVGAQFLRGYSSTEWNQYLDAAGYPRASQLPPGWRPAAATPLAARNTAPPSAPAATPAREEPPPPPPPPRPAPAANNPAGIQF